MAHPWAIVTNEQWAVAWQFDGLATVRDVAWRNGYALCDTLEWVEDLVQPEGDRALAWGHGSGHPIVFPAQGLLKSRISRCAMAMLACGRASVTSSRTRCPGAGRSSRISR